MFDIGFSELMVIAVVALIVIGPERLPKVARTLGHLFGRMQRYVNDVKSDIAREMELDELKKLQAQMQDAARTFEESVTREVNATESELQKIAQEANPLPPPSETKAAPAAGDPVAISAAVPESPVVATPGDVAAHKPASTPHVATTESEVAGDVSHPTSTRA